MDSNAVSPQCLQKSRPISEKGLQQATAVAQFALLAICRDGAVIIISTGMGYIKLPAADCDKDHLCQIKRAIDLYRGDGFNFPVVVMDVRLPRILSAADCGRRIGHIRRRFPGHSVKSIWQIPIRWECLPEQLLVLPGDFVKYRNDRHLYSVPLVCLYRRCRATLLFVLYLSSSSGGLSSNNLILSGIIVAAILSAGISLLKYVADEQVAVIIFWLMGSFGSKTWTDVGLTFLFISFGFLIFMFFARDMNLLSLGNRTASSLGVDTSKVTIFLAGNRLAGCGDLCIRVRDYRFCGAFSPPYDEIVHRTGQPAADSHVTFGRRHFIADLPTP
jgi:iron complex transport system permease protein